MQRDSFVFLILFVLVACTPKETPVPPADSVAPPAPVAAEMPLPASPVGSWRWVSIVTPVEVIQAPAVGQYTLVIGDSTATGVADCNRMTGKATWTDKQLSFGPLATTKMGCPPGGMGDRYLKFLGGAAGWFVRSDTLFVDLKVDSGTMRFVRTE
jgi:heat shock protein HslJ